MTVILDIVFALPEGIPELDSLVTGPGDDLSVISAEADGKDIRSVADESTRSLAGIEIPETKSVVPGCGKGKLTVGGDDDIRDEVVVSV